MILATGDFHVHPYGEFSRSVDKDGLTPLGWRVIRTCEWIHGLAVHHHASILVNGDLTTTPGVLDAPTIHLLAAVEGIFGDHPRVYNLGNHDQGSKGLPCHNLSLNTHLRGVKVVDPNSVWVWLTTDGVYVVPYTHDRGQQEALLSGIPDGAVVAVHYPIVGVYMTPQVAESSGLDESSLRRFRLVLSSHYHVPQVWEPGREPRKVGLGDIGRPFLPPSGTILSLGTPLAHSFSDTNPVYGVALVDTRSGEVTFLRNPHSPQYLSMTVGDFEGVLGHLDTTSPGVFLSLTVPDKTDVTWGSLTGGPEKIFGVPILGARFHEEPKVKHAEVRIPSLSPTEIAPTIGDYASKRMSLSKEEVDAVLEEVRIHSDGLSVSLPQSPELRFRHLFVEGFMSWGEVDLPLDGQGLVAVQGVNQDTECASSNGSGKSSLLESVAWCLFDRTFRGAGKDDVVRSGSRGVKVVVTLSCGGEDYEVSRYRKYPVLGTGVSLRKVSGVPVDLSCTTAAETNKKILAELGLSWDIFCLTTFFGQGLVDRFTALPDSEKKRLFESILGLDAYDELRTRVAATRKAEGLEIQGLSSKQSHLESLVETTEGMLQSAKEAAVAARDAAIEESSNITKSLATLRDSLASKEFSLSTVRGYIEELEAEKRQESESFVSKFDSALAARASLSSVVETLAATQERLHAAKSKLSDLCEDFGSLSSACPTCGGPLSRERLEEIRSAHRAKLQGAKKNFESLSAEVAKLLERKSALESDSSAMKDSDSAGHKKLIAKLDGEIATSRTLADAAASEVRDLQSKVSTFEARYAYLQGKDFFADLAPLESNLAKIRADLDGCVSAGAKIASRIKVLDSCLLALDPRGVRAYLLDGAVCEVNHHLDSVSQALFGRDFGVRISTTTSKKSGEETNAFSLAFSTAGGSYTTASGGERRKADLAVHLALRAFVRSQGRGATNILVADEVLDTLDSVSSSSVVSILEDCASDGTSVFLVSHSPLIASLAQQTLSVTKSNGISSLLTK